MYVCVGAVIGDVLHAYVERGTMTAAAKTFNERSGMQNKTKL